MKKNLFQDIPQDLPGELFQDLLTGEGFRVERIASQGHASAPGFWYDQDWNEWVLVVKGRAGLELKDPDETVTLEPGDYLLLSAGRPHRVAWTSGEEDTIWLAIHFNK